MANFMILLLFYLHVLLWKEDDNIKKQSIHFIKCKRVGVMKSKITLRKICTVILVIFLVFVLLVFLANFAVRIE